MVFVRIWVYLLWIGGLKCMCKIRLAIRKGEEAQYVGHLDFGRALEKALRRAKLPVAYSEGFNPHMKISFGPALAVGVSSCAEYVDVEMTEVIEIEKVIASLSDKLPQGLMLCDVRHICSKGSLSALLNIAVYEVNFGELTLNEMMCAEFSVANFQSAEQVVHVRNSPKGTRFLDIKELLVGDIKLDQKNGCTLTFTIDMTKASVKPQEVIAVLVEQFGFPLHSGSMKRIDLYHEQGGVLKMPFDI